MRIVQGYYTIGWIEFRSQEEFATAVEDRSEECSDRPHEPLQDLSVESRQWRGGRDYYLNIVAWKHDTDHLAPEQLTVLDYQHFYFDADDEDMMARELLWARWNDHTDYVAVLLRHGARGGVERIGGLCAKGADESLPFLRLLFDQVAVRPDVLNGMLHEAAWSDNIETVAFLVERGADLDSRPTVYGHTYTEIPC